MIISEHVDETSLPNTGETPITSSFCCKCVIPTKEESGCSADGICQIVVCDDDPYCCDIAWDPHCASLAQTICDVLEAPNFENFNFSSINSSLPTLDPTIDPASEPTQHHSVQPAVIPVSPPTSSPTYFESTSDLTAFTSWTPSYFEPTSDPTEFPSFEPTSDPNEFPLFSTSIELDTTLVSPTVLPTFDPISYTTTISGDFPTFDPTSYTTTVSSDFPTWDPTEFPTEPLLSTIDPFSTVTLSPDAEPTLHPTNNPTNVITDFPTKVPTQKTTDVEINVCCLCTQEAESGGCALDDECEDIVCGMDRFCCNTEWVFVCAMAAKAVCKNEALPQCCGCTESKDYYYKSRGCWSDKQCERHICSYDPFCCGGDYHKMGYWDTMCRKQAEDVCIKAVNSIMYEGDVWER